MKKAFLGHIILLVAINLLIKPIYVLIIDVQIQNTVGTETYGLFFALFNFIYVVQIIADLGINNYNNKHLAQHPDQARDYLSKIISVKLVLGLLFALSGLLFFFVFGYDLTYLKLFGIILLNQFLLGLVIYLRGNLTALQRYTENTVISVMDKLVLILVLGYLLVYQRDLITIELFALTQTASILITLVVALAFVTRHVDGISLLWDQHFTWQLMRASFPYALVILLMTAYTRIDAVMLERLLDDDAYAAGVYAAAYRLLDASNMIAFLFAGLLLPMFASLVQDRAAINELSQLSLSTILAGAIPLVAFVHYFHIEIIDSFYDAATAEFYDTLLWLFPSFLMICVGYIYGTLITAGDKIQKLNGIFLVGVVLNFGLNYWLIPQYQATGAAVATLITQGLVMTAQVYLAFKYFDLSLSANILLKLAFYTILSIACFHMCSQLAMVWYLAFSVGMGILLLISTVLKLLNPKVLIT